MRPALWPVFALAALAAACPGRPASVDDAGPAGLVDAGTVDAGSPDAGPADAGFVDVVDDPRAPATFDHLLRVGGSGTDSLLSATILDDGTVLAAATVDDTGDVTAGDGPAAIPVDSSAGGVVAGFDETGAPKWAVPVAVDGVYDGGLVVARSPWPGSTTPDGTYIARIDADGALLWATSLGNVAVFNAALAGGAVTVFTTSCAVIGGVPADGCVGPPQSVPFSVARLDGATGAVAWVAGGAHNGTSEFKVGLGAVDDEGRAYLLHGIGALLWRDGVQVTNPAPAGRAAVVALDENGDFRWSWVDDEPDGVGASIVVALGDLGDGTIVAAGVADVVQSPPIIRGGDRDFDNTKTALLVRLDKETGAVVDEQRYAGLDEIAGVAAAGGRAWAAAEYNTRSAPVAGDVAFTPRGAVDGVITALDDALDPVGALPFGGDGGDFLQLTARDDTLVAWTFGGGRLWLPVGGAETIALADGNAGPGGDALAFVYRAQPTLPVPPPAAQPFASSTHLRRVGGSGFDAANGVAFLSDGSLVVTGRFTATDDAVAGDIPLAGELDWPMGFVARFDVDGTPLWAVTAGAPTGIGLGFPIEALAVGADDAVYVAGNVGTGGGRFAFGAVDERDFDGAYVAKLDPSTGAVMWVSPLDASLVAVPALAVDDTGVTAIAAEVTAPSQGFAPTALQQRVLHVDVDTGEVTAGDARPGGIRGVVPALTADFTVRAAVSTGDVTWACGTTSADVDDVDVEADSVLARFDATGALLDEQRFGPEGCTGLALDGDRLVVVDTGIDQATPAYGDVSYDPRGFVDAVVATFDLEGNPLTAKAIGGRGYERALAVATHDGLVAVAGDFRDGFNLDDGTRVVPVRGDALVVLLEDP